MQITCPAVEWVMRQDFQCIRNSFLEICSVGLKRIRRRRLYFRRKWKILFNQLHSQRSTATVRMPTHDLIILLYTHISSHCVLRTLHVYAFGHVIESYFVNIIYLNWFVRANELIWHMVWYGDNSSLPYLEEKHDADKTGGKKNTRLMLISITN